MMDWGYLPEKLEKKLLTFQREGIQYAIERGGRCLIGDEMGLGKTLQAISIAYYYKSEWPLLIILPASLKYQWVEEVEKWLPELLPSDINILTNSFDVGNLSSCKVNIASYSLLRFGNPNKSLLLKAVKAQKFKVMIVDESHNLKNMKSRTSNVVVDLVLTSKRCIMLSGTPAMNKPAELYPQINALQPNRFGTWNAFTLRYCDARHVYFGANKIWTVDGAKNLDELEHKLKQFVMIRRLKKDVLTQLPPKRRQRILFDLKFDDKSSGLENELTHLQEELNKAMVATGTTVAQAVGYNNNGTSNLPAIFEARRLISLLYQKTCEAKVGPVIEFVLFYTANDTSKVLVFAHHKHMMDSIQEALKGAGIKHIRIDGNVCPADRNALVKQFQTKKDIKVALLSILAAGVGLTLTAASVVLLTELYWTPAVLMQAEDRAHRIGQKANSVNIYYLVARGTVDERIWSLVQRKTRVLTMALDGCKGIMSAPEGSKHMANIMSSVTIKAAATTSQSDDDFEEDINADDFFMLADLNKNHQSRVDDYSSSATVSLGSEPSRKRQKKLVLTPANATGNVITVSSDSERDSNPNSPSLPVNGESSANGQNGEQFMNWSLLKESVQSSSHTHGANSFSDDSLPSLEDASVPSYNSKTSPKNRITENTPVPTNTEQANIYDKLDSDDLFSSSDEDLFAAVSSATASPQMIDNSGNRAAQDMREAEALLCSSVVTSQSDNTWLCTCQTLNLKEDEFCGRCGMVQLLNSWECVSCGHVNDAQESSCDECFTDRYAVTEQEQADTAAIEAVPVYEQLYFLVSPHTGRVFLFDKDKKYLQSSFHITDLDNEDALPDILRKPENYKLAEDFTRSWSKLKKREQTVLIKKAKLIIDAEDSYYDGKLTKVKSRQRYKTKADVAKASAAAGGSTNTRLIFPPSSFTDRTDQPATGYVQALANDKTPMCIQCQKALDIPENLVRPKDLKSAEAAWQTRFCSPSCSHQFWMITNNSYIRENAKRLDKGVCQQCGVDAQGIYNSVCRSRSLAKRCELIQSSVYCSLSTYVKVHMARAPKEGLFWHVDHVLPVYAGGGQTDIDNLRTLCTACHQQQTSVQAGDRARLRKLGNPFMGEQKQTTLTDFFASQ